MGNLPSTISHGEKNRCDFLPVVLSSSIVPSRFVTFTKAGASAPDPVFKKYFLNNQLRAYFSDWLSNSWGPPPKAQ